MLNPAAIYTYPVFHIPFLFKLRSTLVPQEGQGTEPARTTEINNGFSKMELHFLHSNIIPYPYSSCFILRIM
jgi:hypothetical protein